MLVITVSLHAQPITHQGTERIAGFSYLEIIKGEDNGRLPLVIAFHYSGGNPTETIADLDLLKMPVRIILPKGNYPKRNGYSFFPTDFYKLDSATQFTLSKVSVDSLATFVRLVSDKFKTKPIVTGISQGGDISFLLAQYHPQLLTAAFPIAAVIRKESINDLARKNDIAPIFLYQGEDDKIVSTQYTQAMVKKINHLKIKLRTYPGVGHEISPAMKEHYSVLIDKFNSGL
jgi:phospholipase/carboxylesterase